MTDTAPSVQPVRAWAVVGTNNIIRMQHLCDAEFVAEIARATCDEDHPSNAPHRVIRVEIREVNDE